MRIAFRRLYRQLMCKVPRKWREPGAQGTREPSGDHPLPGPTAPCRGAALHSTNPPRHGCMGKAFLRGSVPCTARFISCTKHTEQVERITLTRSTGRAFKLTALGSHGKAGRWLKPHRQPYVSIHRLTPPGLSLIHI